MTPWIGLSLMLEDDFRAAAAPLFADGTVDVLEWSLDTGVRPLPPWAEALLDFYASEGRLLGHGVHYSPLSARWEQRQARWLDQLGAELARRRYVHVSEHYGFMTAPPFVRGAPLPVPRCDASLRVARDRLHRMRKVLAEHGCRALGIENLALGWSADEAIAHGPFLDEVIASVDGFIVLDVHNLYCQSENFGVAADDLLTSFPARRVREIHVSGGSFLPAWPSDLERVVRCDTHDHAVPDVVLDLLARALARFPRVKAVIFERLGGTIRSEEEAEAFRRDFRRIKAIVERPRDVHERPVAATRATCGAGVRADEAELERYQSALLLLLAEGLPELAVRERLETDPAFAPFRDHVRAIDGRALGIAARVVKQWGRRAGDDLHRGRLGSPGSVERRRVP